MLGAPFDVSLLRQEGVRQAGPNGIMTKQRITWTPNADGSVRQLWEAADAKGAWTVAFDGRYTKK